MNRTPPPGQEGCKWCNGCQRWVEKEGFSRDKCQGDGLSYRCRECTRARDRRYRDGKKGAPADPYRALEPGTRVLLRSSGAWVTLRRIDAAKHRAMVVYPTGAEGWENLSDIVEEQPVKSYRLKEESPMAEPKPLRPPVVLPTAQPTVPPPPAETECALRLKKRDLPISKALEYLAGLQYFLERAEGPVNLDVTVEEAKAG